MGKAVRQLMSGGAAALAFASPAFSQETTDPAVAPPPVPTEVPAAGTSKRVYTPQDFARYAPKSAYDMLRQIPGFTLRGADQERGFGQASENVLINGQRVSSKSGGAIAESEKISSSSVERIELVDAATLGIAGLTGLVANIVVKASAASGQFAWNPDFRPHFTDPIYTRGSVSYSGTKGITKYTLGLESGGNRSGAGLGRGTTISDGSGEAFEFRRDKWRANSDSITATAKFGFDLAGDTAANLSLSGGPNWYDYRETSRRRRPEGVDRVREAHEEQDGWSYEVGGDIAFGFGPGRLKLIGLTKYSKEPYISTAILDFLDDSASIGDRFARTGKNWEHIGRAEYGWKGGGADWLISAEGAFNKLDSASRIFFLDEDGEFDEIDFPEGTGRVEEDRYEGLLTWSKPLGSRLNLQLVGGAEYSTLTSNSVIGEQSRSFFRPKGSASLAWKASDDLDLSFKIRRRVGQLNFYDFLASVNLSGESENAGNINLVPQQSWEFDLQGNKKLGPWGTSQLRLFYRRIDDIIDIIPIGEDGESPGNVDRANRYGVEWKSTFLFDPIGWKGAKLDTNFTFIRSRLADPLTGEMRSINGDTRRLIELDLRHDVPGTQWAWGGEFFHIKSSAVYRLTQRYRAWEGPIFLSAFVEHKDVFGMTVRAGVSNILNARSRLERVFYDGRRTDPVLLSESRDRLIGPIFTLSVRGKF
ncbi:MAG TPA: TonB-dependent receptor plug domain-containing protein [Sphingomicrobium sp.]|nr:TonB-dependent receptor plug domain-containing protein [Sphingomicrobium sp.]